MEINKVVYLFALLAVATAVILSAASHNALEVHAQANAWRSSGPMSTESFPCVAIDPSNPNTVYAGVSQRGLGLSGVFKSVDGGASWNPTGMPSLSVNALAIDPTRTSTIYASVSSVTAAGIYKSTDAGASWTLTGYRFGASALAIDPKQPNTIYIGAGSGGVFKSTDGGVTWNRPNSSFIQSFHSMVLDPQNPLLIYGATQNNGVFKSADGGVTWNPTAPIDRNTARPYLAIDPNNTSVLYAAYLDIYKTTNGGASWSKINNNLADPNASAVAIDPSNTNTVYIGTYSSYGVMYRSTNGGASWSAFNTGLPQRSVLSLVVDGAGTSLHAGLESGGVYDYRHAASVTIVNAASFSGPNLARESIAAAFGSNLATTTQLASAIPLPTSLAGTTIRVRDSASAERLAPLFFVAPTQINLLIPAGTANGEATVTIISGDGSVSVGTIRIESVAPGLFSANANGRGVAAAVVSRIRADGSQIYEPISRFDQALNQFVPIPLDLGPPTDQLFLILYGTGIRFHSGLSAVTASIGGINAQVLYAGPVDGFVGLDQVNLSVPRNLIGRGEMDVVITVDGKTANTVRVSIGPVTALAPTLTSLSPNSATAGSSAFTLTVNGTNFVNGSVVRWNGSNRTTTFVSNTQLRADIPAADIAAAGTAAITVFNPASGGVSNTLNLTITSSNQGGGPFAGGTFFDRTGGVVGTTFLFIPVTPTGILSNVDVQGPAGWNSNRQLRVSRYQPSGMAAERSIWWEFTQPVTGVYASFASTGSQSYESRASINAANTLPAPEITELTVSRVQVTFRWTASSAAQSFLVRINPLPFAGSITREVIVPGNSRTVTLSGLSLVSGATYQALVHALSLDVATPGAIAGQFNISAHSTSFTVPTTN
ncbi:MAG: IPT/TIG domain-containing protein [Blastocatellia bacterium]